MRNLLGVCSGPQSMSGTRRHVTGLCLAAAASLIAAPAGALTRSRFKAVAFDAFAVFDPGAVASLAESLYPMRGRDLMAIWRTRQFEYTWLRTVAGRYADFENVTSAALVYATRELKLEITAEQRRQLVGAYSQMKTWPDVIGSLAALKAAGLRLALLTNLTPSMLSGCIAAAGIANVLEHVFSTDAAHAFKPDPRAYQLAIDGFQLAREDILFVPSTGWDAAGGRSFGYSTFWINRPGLPPEGLGFEANAVGSTLKDLKGYVLR